MLKFKLNNQTMCLEPNEEGLYRLSGLSTNHSKRPTNFLAPGNWKGKFKSIRGGAPMNQGTWAEEACAIAYIHWIGGEVEGYTIVKPERSEIQFGREVVENLFNGYTILPQFPVLGGKYRIDWYVPELKIAIEFDEGHHSKQLEADARRQFEIEQLLGCRFLRPKK